MLIQTTNHEGKTLWKCEICGKDFPFKSGGKRHVETMHFETPGFECEVCGKILKNKNSYQNHISIIHGIKRRSGLNLMNWLSAYSQTNRSLDDYWSILFSSGDLQVSSTEEGHQCLLCGAIMKHMRNMKRHFIDKHSEQKSHVCQFCKKSYKSKNSMETHQYLYHKEDIMNLKMYWSFSK